MPTHLSRRKIADYAADQIAAGKDVIRDLAVLLVADGRTREVELLVRDIEAALSVRGIVVATVTSAHSLGEDIKRAIAELVGSEDLKLREKIDDSVIGGLRIDLPGQRLDDTIKHKLAALRAQKI
ncbi:MAG: F0F1 ATP synthase subunit delta [Candidatus Saccharimonadaceae bacterium]